MSVLTLYHDPTETGQAPVMAGRNTNKAEACELVSSPHRSGYKQYGRA
jgi:hypothetical protein